MYWRGSVLLVLPQSAGRSGPTDVAFTVGSHTITPFGIDWRNMTMLVHNVYFALKDSSNPAKQKLLAACKKYLTGHPGTLFFACGGLAQELRRQVNDRDFDVALHVVFKDQAAHDQY